MPASSSHSTVSQGTEFDGRLPPPRFAAIETTMYCNLRCHFCIQFQDGTTVRGPHMDEETFEKVSDVLFPHLTEFQPSVSGEPLMSKGLDRVLAKARRYGIRAEYYSNGTLLNPKMQDLILPTLGTLNISFDGATKETFEALRRGAKWEVVLPNVKRTAAAIAELPEEQRPPMGFACTLMEQNIRELPDLVDLAADIGLDFVKAAHVVPGVEEVQGQSLHHHLDVARECIDRAFERAEARGLPFSVQPLDQLISDLADSGDLSSPHFRDSAATDGVALPGRHVHMDKLRSWPSAVPEGMQADLRETPSTVTSVPVADGEAMPSSIWTCHFLWQRIYVGHDGNTMPCCVPGVPALGNLKTDSLDDIWNGETERYMRQALVRQEPAPCCRGCQHIREVTDPGEIRELLAGRSVPSSLPAMPAVLRPIRGAAVTVAETRRSVIPIELAWPSCADADGYEVEMSVDGFRTPLFSSAWHRLLIDVGTFQIPDWAWAMAPADQAIAWRALALMPDERRVVGAGSFLKLAAED